MAAVVSASVDGRRNVLLVVTLLLASVLGGDQIMCTDDEGEGVETNDKVCTVDLKGVDHLDDYSPTERQRLLPDWKTFSIDDLFEVYFDCADIIYGYNKSADNAEKETEEQSEEKWDREVEGIRQELVSIREKYDKENINKDAPIGKQSRHHSMVVSFRVGDAGFDKGRGLFATEKIQKGSLVVNLDNGNLGYFKIAHSWREFVVSLPRETACSFIEWSWVQEMPATNESDDDIRNGLTIFIAFDESNLINNGDWGEGDDTKANLKCGAPMKEGEEWQVRGPCRYQWYATKDIDIGEELLISYSELEDADQEQWNEIGL